MKDPNEPRWLFQRTKYKARKLQDQAIDRMMNKHLPPTSTR